MGRGGEGGVAEYVRVLMPASGSWRRGTPRRWSRSWIEFAESENTSEKRTSCAPFPVVPCTARRLHLLEVDVERFRSSYIGQTAQTLKMQLAQRPQSVFVLVCFIRRIVLLKRSKRATANATAARDISPQTRRACGRVCAAPRNLACSRGRVAARGSLGADSATAPMAHADGRDARPPPSLRRTSEKTKKV